LQTYALQETCAGLGADVEIIDYQSATMAAAKRASMAVLDKLSVAARLRGLVRSPLARLRTQSFRDFSRQHLRLSKRTYLDSTELRQSPPSYDLYLIGSDQVWNHDINGMDTAYFADFVKDRSRVSTYAS